MAPLDSRYTQVGFNLVSVWVWCETSKVNLYPGNVLFAIQSKNRNQNKYSIPICSSQLLTVEFLLKYCNGICSNARFETNSHHISSSLDTSDGDFLTYINSQREKKFIKNAWEHHVKVGDGEESFFKIHCGKWGNAKNSLEVRFLLYKLVES